MNPLMKIQITLKPYEESHPKTDLSTAKYHCSKETLKNSTNTEQIGFKFDICIFLKFFYASLK